MKIRNILSLLFAMLLLAGCASSTGTQLNGEQTAEQYIDPVYPPHYEAVYQELFGADMDTVVEKLGYTRGDFVKVEDILPYYRTEKTVTYLGQEFQVELHFYDPEVAANLARVTLRKELTGTPEEQAMLAVEIGETLKNMFGHQPEHPDEKWEEMFALDEELFVSWLSGTEDKDRRINFRLTDDVAHIPDHAMSTYIKQHPELREEQADIQLEYWLSCYRTIDEELVLRISYETAYKNRTEFVRN